jgi:FkbM family methyltransferase
MVLKGPHGVISTFTDTAEVTKWLQQVQGHIAFDIGANAGFLTEDLSQRFKTVVAVEPAVESYDVLHARWHLKNVIPVNMAVSDHEGEVELGIKKDTKKMGELFTGDSLPFWGPDLGRRTVKCTTLDALAKEYGYPDFIKIDTEGHESYIMDGGHKCMNTFRRPKLCIEIHDEQAGANIQGYLTDQGFPFYIVRHHDYEVADIYPNHYWILSE